VLRGQLYDATGRPVGLAFEYLNRPDVLTKQGERRYFHPDGSQLFHFSGIPAGRSSGGSLQTLDALTGRKVGQAWPINGQLQAAQVGPDGQLVVVAGGNTYSRGKERPGSQPDFSSHAWRPDVREREKAVQFCADSRFALAAAEGGRPRVWAWRDNQPAS